MTNSRQKGARGEQGASVGAPVVVTLPYPPTVNTYWRQWRGTMRLSERGRQYRGAVYAACLEQRVLSTMDGRLAVRVVAFMPDKKRRDLDNIFKGIGDGLVHAEVIADDEQIDRLVIERGGIDRANPRVEVTIAAFDKAGVRSAIKGAEQ